MENIFDMIERLCPDGVEYIKIGEVVNYEQPAKYIVKNTDYDDYYRTPVLTAGQTFILGYTDETDGIYNASKDRPVIIFDDFTGAFKWVDFPFKVKSSAMKILTVKENKTFIRYIFHIMGKIGFSSDKHKRLWISTYSEFKIPFPPIEIQREIVRVLDNFTELTHELTHELMLRKKQYSYYRDMLLTFGDDVERKTLTEIATVSRGIRVVKKQLETTGNIPVYQNSMTPLGYYKKSNCKSNTTFVIGAGAAGEIGFSSVEFWAADDCYYFVCSEKILDRFLYYALLCQYTFIKSQVRKASIPRLARSVIENLKIPVPPIEEQERIVEILDRFDKLCNDLTNGIPAEISARQKQYEYYRNKIFDFKRK